MKKVAEIYAFMPEGSNFPQDKVKVSVRRNGGNLAGNVATLEAMNRKDTLLGHANFLETIAKELRELHEHYKAKDQNVVSSLCISKGDEVRIQRSGFYMVNGTKYGLAKDDVLTHNGFDILVENKPDN